MSTSSTKWSGTTVLIVLLVTTTCSATRAGATNLFGMEHPYLRGVRIEMKDGRKLVGYVVWSSEPTSYDKEPKFPQSLIDPTAYPEGQKVLELFIKLYPVSRKVLRRAFSDAVDWRMVIATRSGTLKLPIKLIARIRALPMKYDGIEATIDGMITDIESRSIIRLLMYGKPFATLMNDDGHVLVSFNRQIGRRGLAAIDSALTKTLDDLTVEGTKRSEGVLTRLRARGVSAERAVDAANKARDVAYQKGWDRDMRRLHRQRVVWISFITED